jgi:hypothetical protein
MRFGLIFASFEWWYSVTAGVERNSIPGIRTRCCQCETVRLSVGEHMCLRQKDLRYLAQYLSMVDAKSLPCVRFYERKDGYRAVLLNSGSFVSSASWGHSVPPNWL